MKILNWMQNKIAGMQVVGRRSSFSPKTKNNYVSAAGHTNNKVDLADWSHGMLAIGTLGNNQFKLGATHPSYDHRPELTNDDIEFSKLQLEITKLLKLKHSEEEGAQLDKTKLMLTLDKFLITLEVDTTSSDENFEATSKGEKARRSKRLACCNGIKHKSLSFLLKKIFVNSGDYPRLFTLSVSRMNTLLRTTLQKKIYPHRSLGAPAGKLLRSRQQKNKSAQDDEEVQHQEEMKEGGYKWVKTDSDFIVLEM